MTLERSWMILKGDFRIKHLFMEKLRILQFFCHPRWSNSLRHLSGLQACNHPSRELFELLKLFLAWVKIGVLKSGWVTVYETLDLSVLDAKKKRDRLDWNYGLEHGYVHQFYPSSMQVGIAHKLQISPIQPRWEGSGLEWAMVSGHTICVLHLGDTVEINCSFWTLKDSTDPKKNIKNQEKDPNRKIQRSNAEQGIPVGIPNPSLTVSQTNYTSYSWWTSHRYRYYLVLHTGRHGLPTQKTA